MASSRLEKIGTIFSSENKTQTQLFIDAYKQLKSQGALDEDKIVEVAQKIVRDKMRERFESRRESVGLVENFQTATEEQKESQHSKLNVTVKNLFE